MIYNTYEIVETYKNNTLKKTAKMYNMTVDELTYNLKKTGFSKRAWKKEQEFTKIKVLIEQGLPLNKIAKSLKVCRTTLWSKMKKLKIKKEVIW